MNLLEKNIEKVLAYLQDDFTKKDTVSIYTKKYKYVLYNTDEKYYIGIENDSHFELKTENIMDVYDYIIQIQNIIIISAKYRYFLDIEVLLPT